MLISIILAWIGVFCCIMTVLKFFARVSGNKTLNRFFHRIHIPFGIILLIVGGLHGIVAGNPSFATLSNLEFASVLFTLNWGTACYIIAIFLGITYMLRKKIGRRWMKYHQVATILLVTCIILHLIDVGIRLPNRIMNFINSEQTTTQSDTQSSESGLISFSGATLADGVYEGSADGYKDTITVSVVVSDSKVTDIEVLSENDTDRFFKQAENVLDTIIGEQTLEVDTVSGATFSSAGLINAVYDALDDAVISGTLNVTDIDLSGSKQQGKH